MKKFKEILNKEDLINYFEGKKFDVINIESSLNKQENYNLEDLQEKFKNQLSITDKKKMVFSDAIFSEIIYKKFCNLDNRDLADTRFWQWISLEYLQDYIWTRWWMSKNSDNSKSLPLTNDQKVKILKSVSKEDNVEIWSPLTIRFLGGTSLKSLTSRQAISRLFWPYKILETTELVRQCFEKQDIAVAVFERQFGLHPEAAKAFIKNISVKHVNLDKKNIQLEAKKLNRYFATISSDYLNQDSIKDLLFE